jgi:glycosyltransferase involved in cell wall biosynthesis
MLQGNPGAVCARPRSVCLVADGPGCLTPADGAERSRAGQLRDAGRQVHVLYCGPGAAAARRRAWEAGLGFSTLAAGEVPGPFRTPNVFGDCHADRSDQVRHVLLSLLRKCPFDVIEFAAGGGLGFRAVQAKRAGLGFEDVCLAVRLDTCGPWRRDQEHRWPDDVEDLAVDYAERFAFEHADAQVYPCPALRDYVRRLGWAVRDDTPLKTDVDNQGFGRPGAERVDASATPLVSVVIPYYNLGAFLPAALASLAAQTYPNLDVLVIDDGSTDPSSVRVFDEMRSLYPRYRFLRQTNAGIGATRNRGLREARGDYFVPMDADNVARPDMVERFVAAMSRNPDAGALTCYFLAFAEGDPVKLSRCLYAHRPTGGPHTLASLRNVYGDGNAVFRAAALRAVGGFETDRDTSFEDWEVFVKLVNAGRRVGVIPDHLFYYRHRASGFSRVTDGYRNHQRVLRQFLSLERLPAAERAVLWTALHGFQRRSERLAARQRGLTYRLADGLAVPLRCVKGGLSWLLRSGRRAWGGLTRSAG